MIDNSISDQIKLDWLNEIDREIFRDICTEFRTDTIILVVDQNNYTLTGYKFENIQKVEVNNVVYNKLSIMDHVESSYYKYNLDIALDPIPSGTPGTMDITYLYIPTFKTINTAESTELELQTMFGEEYSNVYEYYLKYKILEFQREYDEANAMAVMYDNALNEFGAWYLNNVANSAALLKKVDWKVT